VHIFFYTAVQVMRATKRVLRLAAYEDGVSAESSDLAALQEAYAAAVQAASAMHKCDQLL
jgi:hypothetical protein